MVALVGLTVCWVNSGGVVHEEGPSLHEAAIAQARARLLAGEEWCVECGRHEPFVLRIPEHHDGAWCAEGCGESALDAADELAEAV